MKTASLIQFNRIIFQLTFTLAPAARPLVPHCVSLHCLLTPLAESSTVWLSPVGVRGGWQRWANTLLISHVLSWLGWWQAAVLGSQSAVHTACLPAARTHTH